MGANKVESREVRPSQIYDDVHENLLASIIHLQMNSDDPDPLNARDSLQEAARIAQSLSYKGHTLGPSLEKRVEMIKNSLLIIRVGLPEENDYRVTDENGIIEHQFADVRASLDIVISSLQELPKEGNVEKISGAINSIGNAQEYLSSSYDFPDPGDAKVAIRLATNSINLYANILERIKALKPALEKIARDLPKGNDLKRVYGMPVTVETFQPAIASLESAALIVGEASRLNPRQKVSDELYDTAVEAQRDYLFFRGLTKALAILLGVGIILDAGYPITTYIIRKRKAKPSGQS